MQSCIDWSHRSDSRMWYNIQKILGSRKCVAAPSSGMVICSCVIDCTVVRLHSDGTKLKVSWDDRRCIQLHKESFLERVVDDVLRRKSMHCS
jgi:hypothetical protein